MEKEVNCISSKAILGYVKTYNNDDCSGATGGILTLRLMASLILKVF